MELPEVGQGGLCALQVAFGALQLGTEHRRAHSGIRAVLGCDLAEQHPGSPHTLVPIGRRARSRDRIGVHRAFLTVAIRSAQDPPCRIDDGVDASMITGGEGHSQPHPVSGHRQPIEAAELEGTLVQADRDLLGTIDPASDQVGCSLDQLQVREGHDIAVDTAGQLCGVVRQPTDTSRSEEELGPQPERDVAPAELGARGESERERLVEAGADLDPSTAEVVEPTASP